MEAIMDLIGSIKLIENTLGRRYSNQPSSKPASKNKLRDAEQETPGQADQHHLSPWDEIQIGRNIDTVA
jgi:hypothetical protein